MNTDVNTSAGSNQSVAATTLAQNAFQGDLMAHAKALPDTWQQAFADTHTQDILHSLDHYLTDQLARQAQIFPLRPFRALLEIEPPDVQVVIPGQAPYHGPTQAQALAFSVPDACRPPPTLREMFADRKRDE